MGYSKKAVEWWTWFNLKKVVNLLNYLLVLFSSEKKAILLAGLPLPLKGCHLTAFLKYARVVMWDLNPTWHSYQCGVLCRFKILTWENIVLLLHVCKADALHLEFLLVHMVSVDLHVTYKSAVHIGFEWRAAQTEGMCAFPQCCLCASWNFHCSLPKGCSLHSEVMQFYLS